MLPRDRNEAAPSLLVIAGWQDRLRQLGVSGQDKRLTIDPQVARQAKNDSTRRMPRAGFDIGDVRSGHAEPAPQFPLRESRRLAARSYQLSQLEFFLH